MSLYTQTVQEELFQLSSLYFLLRWLEAETQKATSQFVSASISSGKADAGDGLLILSRAAQPNSPADANSLATEACSAALPQSGIPESLSEMKTADIFARSICTVWRWPMRCVRIYAAKARQPFAANVCTGKFRNSAVR